MPPAVGRVFLTDFGLARDVASTSHFTRTGATLGTPAYMSPELARGEFATLTPASDVWALGCVLYECQAGRRAFEGDSPAAVIGAVLAGAPRRLREAPRSLDRLVRACLARAPGDRPRDAGAVRDDAQRVLDGLVPLARPPGRRRGPAIVGTAAVLGTALALVAWPAGRGPTVPGGAGPTRADALAATAWEMRMDRPADGARLLGQALDLEPARHEWRLQLGLLRWAAGDDERAMAAWRAVPDPDPAATAARWLEGLALTARATETGEPAAFRAATIAWRDAARGAGAEARWAAAGLAALAGEHAAAREGLRDAQDWQAALLRGMTETDAANRRAPAEVPEGIAAYTVALERGLPLAGARNGRGLLHHAAGDAARALADYDAALALRPGYEVVLVNRGALRQSMGDVAGARADFDAAVARRPDYYRPYFSRGNLRLEAGDVEGALADYEVSIQANPDHAESWLNRAILRYRRVDLAGARQDFDAALRLLPRWPAALHGRALVRIRTGDPAGGGADLDAALAAGPEFAECYYERAVLRQSQGDASGARADYDALLARRPTHGRGLSNRAFLRVLAGDRVGALADLDAALGAEPDLTAARFNRALFHQQDGRVAAALADYDRVIADQPDHLAARCNRGALRLELDDAAGAAEDYGRAVAAKPDLPDAHAGLGLARIRLRDPAGAADAFRRFLALAPDHPRADEVRRQLAACEAATRR